MEKESIFGLECNQEIYSIHETDGIYLFNKLVTIKNRVHVQVQKITDNGIELLNFPMNQFLNEFVIHSEPIEIEITETPIVEETPKKKKKDDSR